DIEIDFVPVTLPESIGDIQVLLKASFAEKLKALKKTGLAPNINTRYATKKDLLGLQAELHQDIARGARDGKLWQAVSVMAELMKLQHALELAETQSVESLTKYLDTIKAQAEKKATKAVKSLMNDAYFKTAMFKAYELLDKKVEHPKIEEIKKIVRKEVSSNPNAKVIVFNQYRDSASQMLEELNNIPGIRAAIFVGQMKKGETGLSQKEQKAVLDRFRQGEINVLVSTSVGEEGLDVPAVDLVVFYEPIPSAIRTIQRRGRTARQKEGRVVVLVTKGTRDEAYRWTAHHKEKRMHRTLKELKDKLGLVKLKEKQPTLKEFAGSKIVVFADHREKGSGAIKELLELNVELKLEQLAIGDYILSKRVAVEFKTVQDFVNSLIDGRLFEQVKSIKESFPKPLIMVEGEESIYGVRNVHPNAINGMLAAIAVDFGVPVLYTKTARESAAMLYTIAKREQDELGVSFSPHADKHVTSLPEQQEYIVSSFPGIGTALARPLLKHFKTIKNIANASEQDLQGVTLIGKKKAAEIRKVLDGEYRP
ncbi:Hef nuclease, partial [Candidatus Woesearchaeota archaeon]|nr:Hef nuclease [Candidatus Woesearchaeota archaeon]